MSAGRRQHRVSGARVAGARVAGARAAGARAAGARVAGARVAGARVAGARVAGARVAGARVAGARVAGARVAGARVAGSGSAPWRVAGLTVALAALAGCGGSAPVAGPPSAVATASPAAAQPTCASPGPAAAAWPPAVPAELPKPPGSVITGTQTTGQITYVQFTSPVSLREGVQFVVTELKDAGYTLGRGDAEAAEADAPFNGPTIIGALRLTRTGPCLTSWVLAVEPRSVATVPGPLLPHTAGPSPSPLPFG